MTLDYGIKQLKFNWITYPGKTSYRLWGDNGSGYNLIKDTVDIIGTSATIDISVHLLDWINSKYYLQACNSTKCIQSNIVFTNNNMPGSLPNNLKTIGYIKASNPGTKDLFGLSLAISADGLTLAVATYSEASHAGTLLDPKQGGVINDPTKFPKPDAVPADNTGAVFIYTRDSSTDIWAQRAYVKADIPVKQDYFGQAVALSADGLTLAVGAPGANFFDGAVFLFTQDSKGQWAQQGKAITGRNVTQLGSPDFGGSIVLSADGSTLVVGSKREENSLGITTGVVYVYSRSGSVWTEQGGGIIGLYSSKNSSFGSSLALSADGATLVVGAANEGVAYIYNYITNISTSGWYFQSFITGSNTKVGDSFGTSVALNAAGSILVVGAPGEDSAELDAGAVYVFTYNNRDNSWTQQAGPMSGSNTGYHDGFGHVIALNTSGTMLAVGAPGEGSHIGTTADPKIAGIINNPNNFPTPKISPAITSSDTSGADYTGAVYLFNFDSTVNTWEQRAYIKSSNPEPGDGFGGSVALSHSGVTLPNGATVIDKSGSTLAVSAASESSNATGVSNSNIVPNTNNSVLNAGAVYLY